MDIFKAKSIKMLLPIGVLDAIQVLAQNIALVFALPVFVQSVGSTSMLFSSVFGFYFFKERIDTKLLPTFVIVFGIILITISQNLNI